MTKTIVVIGAGFFGVSTANRLAKHSKDYKVKLISKSNYTYFLVSAIRIPVFNEPKGTVIPLSEVVHDSVEIINDEVIDFYERELTLKVNGELSFDALIIATGAKWPEPIGYTHEFSNDYEEYFQKQHDKLEKAKRVVLVGGGFNNIELGGELFDKYGKEVESGNKRITIIHSAAKLLPNDGTYGDVLREKITNFFQNETKFELILNTRAKYKPLEDGSYEVDLGDGKEPFNADVLYHNVGVIPSVPPNNIKGLTNEKGFIKVNDSFQVTALPNANIFAIGDVVDFDLKSLQFRRQWMNVLCFNVQKTLEVKWSTTQPLQTVKRPTGPQAALVSVGKRNGFGQFVVPYFGKTASIPNWYVTTMKSRHLGVPFAKHLIGNS